MRRDRAGETVEQFQNVLSFPAFLAGDERVQYSAMRQIKEINSA